MYKLIPPPEIFIPDKQSKSYDSISIMTSLDVDNTFISQSIESNSITNASEYVIRL